MTFEQVVAEWMRGHGYADVATVTRCDGQGSDWAGSTESGFYDEFRVWLAWETTEGKTMHGDISGEEMQSLWMHVVGAWSNDGH